MVRWSDMGAPRDGPLRARPEPAPGARRWRRCSSRSRCGSSRASRRDAARTLHRLRPAALLAPPALPFALLVPLVLGLWGVYWFQVDRGCEGRRAKKRGQGLLAAEPGHLEGRAPAGDLAGVDLDLELEPARSAFRVDRHVPAGEPRRDAAGAVPADQRPPLEDARLDAGRRSAYEPEDRAGLYVFTPPRPLAAGRRAAARVPLPRHASPTASPRTAAGRRSSSCRAAWC